MKRTVALALAAPLLCSALALASGTASGTDLPTASGVDPFTVTETMKCTITEILPDGAIIARHKKSKKLLQLAVTEKTEYKAEKPIEGRKQLLVGDLRVGFHLRVTSRRATGEVLKVKVLKKGLPG